MLSEYEIKQLMKICYEEGFNSGIKSLDKNNFTLEFDDKIDNIYRNFKNQVKK